MSTVARQGLDNLNLEVFFVFFVRSCLIYTMSKYNICQNILVIIYNSFLPGVEKSTDAHCIMNLVHVT